MRVATLIAVGAMLIGCVGVGNVVVAGIDARRFEFGVLRAAGADASLLARLVIGEVLVIAVTACILGALLGAQVAFSDIRLYELVAGIQLRLRPPVGPILLGCAILVVLTLAAATPAAIGLSRLRPRELLASVRG
jgi:putative ABC transport system permease protein